MLWRDEIEVGNSWCRLRGWGASRTVSYIYVGHYSYMCVGTTPLVSFSEKLQRDPGQQGRYRPLLVERALLGGMKIELAHQRR